MAITMKPIPIFIPTRDRVSHLAKMVDWFERAGHEEIYFVDNDSTYLPLLEYFQRSPHRVLPVGKNLGWKSPWQAGYVSRIAKDRFYVVGDSDMVPVEDCPLDALEVFREALLTYEEPSKVSFCYKLDDIPEAYPHKGVVDAMSKVHQNVDNIVEKHFVRVPVDSIPAVYRPNIGHNKNSWMSIRHEIRHMSWYEDTRNPEPELAYYQARANHAISQWSWPELNKIVTDTVKQVGDRNGEWLSLAQRRELSQRESPSPASGESL